MPKITIKKKNKQNFFQEDHENQNKQEQCNNLYSYQKNQDKGQQVSKRYIYHHNNYNNSSVTKTPLSNISQNSFQNIIIKPDQVDKNQKKIRASIGIRCKSKQNQIPALFASNQPQKQKQKNDIKSKQNKQSKLSFNFNIKPIDQIPNFTKKNNYFSSNNQFQTPKSRVNSSTKSIRKSFGNRLFNDSQIKSSLYSRDSILSKRTSCSSKNFSLTNTYKIPNNTQRLNSSTKKNRKSLSKKIKERAQMMIAKMQAFDDQTNQPQVQTQSQNIKVYVRIKPVTNVEDNQCVYHLNPTTIRVEDRMFAFDEVFPGCSTQNDIFKKVAIPVLQSLFEGYNGTIFAYGQTGSGKTYTIFGDQGKQNQGIISKTISYIYQKSEQLNRKIQCMKCSMLQIYKQNLIDLFDTSKNDLKLKQSKNGLFIDGISQKYIESQLDFLTMITQAQKKRRVASTKINQKSSRSHTILTTIIRFQDYQCKLCLIDLAGSQKINKAGVAGLTLQQTKKINYSLSCLGNVINALVTRKKSDHIPFRDSKLTRILKESLSGKFKTSIIVNCSAQQNTIEQTLSSLKFAERAKKVKINPKNIEKKVNKESIQYLHSVIKKLTNDLNLTKKQLCRYKAICDSINGSNQTSSNGSFSGLRVNLDARSLQYQPTPPQSCRMIPSQRAYVDETMKNYQQSNTLKESINKVRKIQTSFFQNNLSSLNVSNSHANVMGGVCSPSLSSLSFRQLNSSRLQSSFTLSLCKDQQNIDSFKNRFQNLNK